MLRTSLSLFAAVTLISSTAQASPYAASVRVAAAPGYAAPGEPAPAPTPAPEPYAAQPDPNAQPQPYGQPQPYAQPQPYGQPGPAPYTAPPQQRRRGKGMMIAGFTVFGASYLSTALVGAAVLDTSNETVTCYNCERVGASLLVPVVGPLIAVPALESATGTIFAILSFVAQAGGLSLGIAGAVLWTRDGRRMQQAPQAGLHLGRGVRLTTAPRIGGGMLNLSYRF